MRKSVLALAGAALMGAVSTASAADITGTIKSIDATTKTVTLDNGYVYKFPSNFQGARFNIGEKVKITYSGTGSKMMASEIQKAS